MNKNTYTEELVTETENSTPEARAERLRRVRNLANLSRKEICEAEGFNINTYKGWELARFGGVSVDGANKVVKRIAQSGVICSTEWLLYGKKPLPRLASDVVSAFGAIEVAKSEIELIQSEFAIYQGNVQHAILIEVTDDGLFPHYKVGDFLAGSKKFDTEIKQTVNKICIVETTDGKKCVRYIKPGREEGLYTLMCTNYHTTMNEIAIYNTNLLYSAPISRHYIIK